MTMGRGQREKVASSWPPEEEDERAGLSRSRWKRAVVGSREDG
jgi:hypothetical protein